jgi:uncharacterized protein YceH (UPF0502 family)
MTRVEEVLAELDADYAAERSSRAGAPAASLYQDLGGGIYATDTDAVADLALEVSAQCAVLRRRVAELTARLEQLEGARP